MQTLLTLMAVAAVLTAAMIAAGAVVLWRTARRVRRAVQARMYTARMSTARICAARDVTAVRRAVRHDVEATTGAVAAGLRAGRPLEGLEHGLAQLAEQARSLDLDLSVVAAERDRATRSALLAPHAERAAQIHATCCRVRAAVLADGACTGGSALHSVLADLDDHAGALEHRARAYQELSSLPRR